MNIIIKTLMAVYFLLFSSLLKAAPEIEGPILKIGMGVFAPPFSIMGPNGTASGFDAEMIQYICMKLKTKCLYIPIRFDKIFDATVNGEIDMSTFVAITPERAKYVNFSTPYIFLSLRFLTRTEIADQSFSLDALANKTIGYEKGTVIEDAIKKMNIINPKLRPYKTIGDEISALNDGKIDFVLIDSPSAVYWQNNSSSNLKTFGKAMSTKHAVGIAITPVKPELVQPINDALRAWFADGGYKTTYDRYLQPFE